MTPEERLDRLERVLGTAIRLADKRMERIEKKLEILVDTQIKTDEGLDRLHEEIRNLTAIADRYFQTLDKRGSA